jgi:periplasmic protein TonB
MSDSVVVNPPPSDAGKRSYALSSDLARMCLPSAFKDGDHRRLAWANSVCLLFLVIGLVGFQSPSPVQPPPRKAEVLVPVLFTPPPEQPKPQPQPERISPAAKIDTVQAPETPEVVRVVPAASPAAVAFAVPVQVAEAVPVAAYEPAALPVTYEAPPTPAAGFNPNTRVDGGHYPPPQYPSLALRNHYQGTVIVGLIVDGTGAVASAEIQKTSGYAVLDEAALEVVKKRWKFPPGPRRSYYWPCEFRLE